jgi:hypothetical protein
MLCALAVVVGLTACDGDEPADPATATPTVTATEPTPATEEPTAEPSPTATATEAPTETADQTDEPDEGDSGELPGEPIDIFPYEGASLGVVGVEADDTLNVRSGPGVDFDVVTELAPLADGFTATGANRQLDDGAIWAQIETEEGTGWANTAFLAHPGATDDVTSQLYPATEDRPRAETMLELGQTVGEAVASDEPPSTITVVDGPTVGDLGEITVDVIGLGDDALRGLRLHVFAQPDEGGETFTVRTVEQTFHCTRGVTDDGLCL